MLSIVAFCRVLASVCKAKLRLCVYILALDLTTEILRIILFFHHFEESNSDLTNDLKRSKICSRSNLIFRGLTFHFLKFSLFHLLE